MFKSCIDGNLSQLNTYLENGGSANLKNKDKESLLMLAAKHGHLPVVSALLEAKASVNYRIQTNDGVGPLTYAAQNNHLPVLTKLMQAKNAKATMADLIYAAAAGCTDAVKAMWTHYHFDRLSPTECGVLHEAMAVDKLSNDALARGMKVLLDIGAARLVNARDDEEATVLMTAAAKKGSGELIRVLVDAGADVNAEDDNGVDALTLGLWSAGNARALLEAGANCNKRISRVYDMTSPTKLQFAAREGHVETVKVLIEFGAHIHAVDALGFRALDLAARKGWAEAVKVLLEAGAGDEEAGRRWVTGRIAEIEKNNKNKKGKGKGRGKGKKAVEAQAEDVEVGLLSLAEEEEHGFGLERGVIQDVTVLYLSVLMAHEAVVRVLLEAGADPNKPALHDRTTPLMSAFRRRERTEHFMQDVSTRSQPMVSLSGWLISSPPNAAIVRMLLEAGADATAVDRQGRDVMWFARESGIAELVEMVREAVEAAGGARVAESGVGTAAAAVEAEGHVDPGEMEAGAAVSASAGIGNGVARKRGRVAAAEGEEKEEEKEEGHRGKRRRMQVQ